MKRAGGSVSSDSCLLTPDSYSSFRMPPSSFPSVSVVIPCYNEERFIGKVLENLAGQYDEGGYEIVVVDGMSTDGTRAVIDAFRASHPDLDVRVVDNPARNIPAALNLGINEARGQVVVRMDAHSVASPNYVRRCVEVLRGGGADVVGMPWRIRPGADTAAARAIALAVAHPFGIGDAKYRLSGESEAAREVDTVPFGSFRRELWQSLGGFNEELLANEDYDFNYRARQRGKRVLLDTSEHCEYFARPTVGALAAQYFRYGTWKARMLRLHPRSVRARQLAAPLFVLSLALSAALAPWWWPARPLFAAVGASYSLAALLSAAQLARRGHDAALFFVLPVVFFTIHCAWGTGFLFGLLRGARKTENPVISDE
jgi:succinoglycan biosynthesis protein ExoA